LLLKKLTLPAVRRSGTVVVVAAGDAFAEDGAVGASGVVVAAVA
jgi:hypothetical protein